MRGGTLSTNAGPPRIRGVVHLVRSCALKRGLPKTNNNKCLCVITGSPRTTIRVHQVLARCTPGPYTQFMRVALSSGKLRMSED